MPIYEYRCEACGHEMEALQKMSDAPLTDCPKCQQAELVKKISAAGFRLKGGGWYETDFKSGKQKNLAGGGESKKPASGGKSESAAAASAS
ncbi:zinc ribbon domain-containing protein [Gilvimarinus sp. DA14]|uniref:FmdB family zinc ribbon protein n=1 Tax=Gilvimarinus sp. DA14 TaxID=2956798 RepID=UPI0020B72CA1|nr:zinc ribbon domain-containing protein [Gilvimarinus sp. DA14]UTF60365.1 zinc ribbon domain-containing protein [Gilvimarinus sp. DA14]